MRFANNALAKSDNIMGTVRVIRFATPFVDWGSLWLRDLDFYPYNCVGAKASKSDA